MDVRRVLFRSWNAWSGGESSTSLGESAFALADGATALGAGSSADGLNSVALGAGSIADRDNSVSVGSAGNERQITNVAAGTEDTDAVNKSQLDEVAGSVGELTDTVVQYDDEDKDTVTLAGEEGTAIGNVAAGPVSATSMRSEEHPSELPSP